MLERDVCVADVINVAVMEADMLLYASPSEQRLHDWRRSRDTSPSQCRFGAQTEV